MTFLMSLLHMKLMKQAYYMLVLVHGLKVNDGYEINHLCEFDP